MGASCLDNEGALKLADDGGLDADIRPDLDKQSSRSAEMTMEGEEMSGT